MSRQLKFGSFLIFRKHPNLAFHRPWRSGKHSKYPPSSLWKIRIPLAELYLYLQRAFRQNCIMIWSHSWSRCVYWTNFKEKEPPSPLYMVNQKEITPKMRSILVDWLVEVVDDYELSFESLHLAINYVDRYLSAKVLPKIFLQLLGISCLLISSKFVEREGMKIKDAVDVCSGCYTQEQVLYIV